MVGILTEDKPVRQKPYRIPLVKRTALDAKLDELLEQGVIALSSFPWAPRVVLVAKKDSSEGPRFCVYYMALNKITKKASIPSLGQLFYIRS